MQHVVEVQRTLPEKLTQSPVKTNIWNFILFCKLVFRYWRGSRAVHRCVNFKPHRHMGSPLLILETYVCSICTGNRFDVLGDLSPNLPTRKISQDWTMKWNEKSQSSHDPCSAASSWRLKHLETGFHSYSYNIHLFKTQWFFHPANQSIRWLVTRGLRWLQDIAKTGRLFFPLIGLLRIFC